MIPPILDWERETPPYRCPYCGAGDHWTDYAKLVRHFRDHIRIIGRIITRPKPKGKRKTKQNAHLWGELKPRTVRKIDKFLVGRERMVTLKRRFQQTLLLRRELKMPRRRTYVQMPLPEWAGSALMRDLKERAKDRIPTAICIVSNNPYYRFALGWAAYRGWKTAAISLDPEVNAAAGTALPLTLLEKVGWKAPPTPEPRTESSPQTPEPLSLPSPPDSSDAAPSPPIEDDHPAPEANAPDHQPTPPPKASP